MSLRERAPGFWTCEDCTPRPPKPPAVLIPCSQCCGWRPSAAASEARERLQRLEAGLVQGVLEGKPGAAASMARVITAQQATLGLGAET